MRSPAARLALPAAVAIVVLVAVVATVAPPAVAQEDVDERTTFEIDVRQNGDAQFTVTLRLHLESEEEVAAFERRQDDLDSGSGSPLSVAPYERAAAGTAEVTGREMEIRDVSRSAERQNRTGRLVLSFTWTEFAEVSEDRLAVGDAFRTPDGTWLPQLAEGQELVLSFPSGYEVQSVSRPVTNGTIHVEGPASFEPGQPSAVLSGSSGPLPEGLLPLAVGGAVLLVVLALVVYYLRTRGIPGDVEWGTSTAATEEEGDAPTEAQEGEPAPAVDPELLSDEERVLRLLENRGGRMKQVDIVEETDWSNAKVSQLLSEMEEADRVEKLRIGRENLISLPGQGPAAGNSNPGEFD